VREFLYPKGCKTEKLHYIYTQKGIIWAQSLFLGI
jgi:hypothetical protein